MLAEFSSVVDAVRCAVEMQRAMADRNAETVEDKRITFRVGINLGEVIAEEDDIYGDGVNVAARLEALAEPGGICISRMVRDQIRDKLPYPFEDKGEQSVKNIVRSVRVFALGPEAVAELPATSVSVLAQRRPRIGLKALATAGVLAIAVGAWWLWPAKPSNMPAIAAATAISQPLLLICLEGMRYEQVATILDIPVGTVRSRLSRARTTLHLLMDGAKSANNRWNEHCDDLAA
jgi:hypothetical protein